MSSMRSAGSLASVVSMGSMGSVGSMCSMCYMCRIGGRSTLWAVSRDYLDVLKYFRVDTRPRGVR